MRIHVTGNAGAGKTMLASRLGTELNLPVTHLDQIVWAPGWKKVPAQERDAALRKITERDHWIIEGVSAFVRQRADLVIFLNTPRHVCFWRCAKRNARYLLTSRPELPERCPEWRILPKLVRIIWQFPRLVGRHIHREAGESSAYVVLDSNASAGQFLEGFRAAA